ncbi:MAG: type I-B CRISPR-associated protein Cas7/Csh2 [Candidatus Magnetomorum sp.]|nr:type I-B CRISPR-associated protein Cas7/Csh2 [Candidatus Magnetomorum sp.]
MATIKNNNEILFIYDAKLSNPNGDMDNENKPRMDYDTHTNLVSDVRLKRYLRDYFEQQLKLDIFITDKAKDAKDRDKQLKKEKKSHADLIDSRMFGAVFAATGGNDHIFGPIQFNWGYSLNPVEINESNTITCKFSSGGGVGKDYRVKYSLIAFSGSINATVAQMNDKQIEGVGLTEDDIKILDEAMVQAILSCRSRSKIGQTPRFYLRVELNDNKTFLNDMRERIQFIPSDGIDPFKIQQIDQFEIDVTDLVDYLEQFEARIKQIHIWQDQMIQIKGINTMKEKYNNKIAIIDPLKK